MLDPDHRGEPLATQRGGPFLGLSPDETPHFSEADSVPMLQDFVNTISRPLNCRGELGVQWNRFVKQRHPPVLAVQCWPMDAILSLRSASPRRR
jgi:hypothetical protein